MLNKEDFNEISHRLHDICNEIEKKIIGQRTVVRHTVAACLAGGHVLFEDVPGTGKTTLANAVSQVLGLAFSRVQGTPDLLPGDLVGTNVFDPKTTDFRFRKGPIFTEVLLFDEINRATPRTQSALLEAMAEASVSVDGETHTLSSAFFVMATANPIESSGVFPLPEAQLDRFLVQLKLGYTSEDDELEMVRRIRLQERPQLQVLLMEGQLLRFRAAAAQVQVVPDVLRYIVQLCRRTRSEEGVILGASPRSVLSLTSFAQALALFEGRNYVIPDDVQEAWIPVMRHRIQTHLSWQSSDEIDPVEKLLRTVMNQIVVPAELTTNR